MQRVLVLFCLFGVCALGGYGQLVPAHLLKTTKPVYPPEARANGIEGDVIVDVQIDDQGNVTSAVPRSGDPQLAGATVDAVLQWRYAPATAGGKPIASRNSVVMQYHLKDDEPRPVFVPNGQQGQASGAIIPAHLLKTSKPFYPPEARANGIEGDVTLDIQIDDQGNVTSAIVRSGDPHLARAAVDSVLQWRYAPAMAGGKPIASKNSVVMQFHLNGDQPRPAPVPEQTQDQSATLPPQVIQRVPPVYPQEAREERLQGNVIVAVEVDERGKVVRATSEEGSPRLTSAAVDAVRQWKFKPAVLRGKPVRGTTKTIVQFRLE